MTIKFTNIPIDDSIKEDFFRLFWFMFYNINKYIFVKIYIFLILFKFIVKISNFNLSTDKFCSIFLIFILFSISTSLEETFHAALIIIQGRKREVESLVINTVQIKKIKVIGIGVSVYFSGEFTQNDILYITMSGPICSLIWGLILWIILFLPISIVGVGLQYHLISLLGIIFLPLCSLIPFKNSFVTSDGYKIYVFIKKYEISMVKCKLIISELFQFSYSYLKQSLKKPSESS
jgi:hypothetical protein